MGSRCPCRDDRCRRRRAGWLQVGLAGCRLGANARLRDGSLATALKDKPNVADRSSVLLAAYVNVVVPVVVVFSLDSTHATPDRTDLVGHERRRGKPDIPVVAQ